MEGYGLILIVASKRNVKTFLTLYLNERAFVYSIARP